MRKTIFDIPKMDCPSEEKIIRIAVADIQGIKHLQFDLTGRKLIAFHEEGNDKILNKLKPLNFGARILDESHLTELEETLVETEIAKSAGLESKESKILWILLIINAAMFVLEIILGIISQSTGLISDAMDMFADAAVYGISLYAVGKSIELQRKSARFSGYGQFLLVFFALTEVIRRFIFGSDPEPNYMMAVSLVALLANVACLILITKHRSDGVHMRASAIFSANDVIANCGVIVAGALVSWTGSRIPDLIIGFLIAAVVFRGAIAILKISQKSAME